MASLGGFSQPPLKKNPPGRWQLDKNSPLSDRGSRLPHTGPGGQCMPKECMAVSAHLVHDLAVQELVLDLKSQSGMQQNLVTILWKPAAGFSLFMYSAYIRDM